MESLSGAELSVSPPLTWRSPPSFTDHQINATDDLTRKKRELPRECLARIPRAGWAILRIACSQPAFRKRQRGPKIPTQELRYPTLPSNRDRERERDLGSLGAPGASFVFMQRPTHPAACCMPLWKKELCSSQFFSQPCRSPGDKRSRLS